MIDSKLLIVGAVLVIIGDAMYVRDVFRGTSSPNRITFAIWTVVPLIAFAAELEQSVGWAAAATLFAGAGPASILVASMLSRHGQWRLGTLDYVCGLLSLMAVVVWRLTSDPNLAILLSIVADLVACVPTFRKALIDPASETAATYVLSGVSSLTGVLVAKSLTFEAVAFNLWCVVACACMALLILVPRPRPEMVSTAGVGPP